MRSTRSRFSTHCRVCASGTRSAKARCFSSLAVIALSSSLRPDPSADTGGDTTLSRATSASSFASAARRLRAAADAARSTSGDSSGVGEVDDVVGDDVPAAEFATLCAAAMLLA